MAENTEWRRKFLSVAANLAAHKRWFERLGMFFLLTAVIGICGHLFTVPLLAHLFHVPAPVLPEALTASSIERANQEKLPLSQMGSAIIAAVLAAEDRRFYKHHGIDLPSALRATIDNLRAGRMVEGGSTITQQLAKIVFLDFREKTANRKIQQWILAWELEERYAKDRILETYLNEIYFGNGCYGVEAAARFYFAKHASRLDLAEAAFLAGLVRAPSQSGLRGHREQAIVRQKEILTQIAADKLASPPEVAGALQEKLHFTAP